MHTAPPSPEKVLLHVCCGVCSLHVIEMLQERFKEVILYFYNPNIHPKEEYDRRLAAVKDIAARLGLCLIEGPYDPEHWHDAVVGYEKEPEGGARCPLCYTVRLREAARVAQEKGAGIFATTLTISPHKKAAVINGIGTIASRSFSVAFLEEDFKKRDGFKKTMTHAKEHNVYRQNYCGCAYAKSRQTS
jgi:hypothetical protein